METTTNINNSEVIEPTILNKETMNTAIEEKVNLSDLTPQQKKALLEEARAEEKAAQANKNSQREAYKQLVEETVPKAIFNLGFISEALSNAKRETFMFFEQILTLKNEVYGLKEKQRSHTFSADGAEITIGYRINDGWDDTATIGIEKVNNFLKSLSTDDKTAMLVDTVFNLLKKDSKGNLKGSRVLELQKMTETFKNDEFTDGVDIISKAFRPIRSSWFIEAFHVSENAEKTSIPLSMSSVDFAQGYKFDFFAEEKEETTA